MNPNPAVLGALFAASLGCGTTRYALPAPVTCASAAPQSGLLAATVRVDITPPVGLSMFGHGLESRIGTGTLTRLECRGFVFREAREAVAWVVCDLGGMSLALQRRTAELIRQRIPLGADRLVMTATHTHAGPVGFFETNAFLNPLGGTRDPFYDQRVTDFIADRVASEVVLAWDRVAPASLRTASDDDVRGINRNRSMPARMRDPEFIPRDPTSAGLDPAHINANRALPVLRVDIEQQPAGLLGVFGVHATAIPNTNERYHGDLIAFARRFCEGELAARYPGRSPICAIAPGTEGDASPDWGTQHLVEAQRIGARLGYHLVRLFESADRWVAAPGPALDVRYREVILPGARIRPGSSATLAPWAEIGLPAAGGAPDGPTRVRIVEQMNPGMINPIARDGHGRRSALLGMFPSTVEEARDGYMFPVRAPLWWLRLGPWAFATVPMEPTFAAGERIRSSLHSRAQAAAPGVVAQVIPVGLTGLYLDYLVTPEEYEMQLYEGASCVYGYRTLDFVQERLRELVSAAPPAPSDCTVPFASTPATPLASTHTPPTARNQICGGVHPGVVRDGTPTQPVTGAVGTACFAPHEEYVRERWPDGLALADACGSEARALSERLHYATVDDAISVPEVVDLAEGWAVEVSWVEDRNRPMCGVPGVVLVGGEGATAAPVEACRALANLAAPAPYLDASQDTPMQPCEDGAASVVRSLVTDETAMIEVWRDFETEGRWHARFRVPRGTAGFGRMSPLWWRDLPGKRFAVRQRNGEYHLSHPLGAMP